MLSILSDLCAAIFYSRLSGFDDTKPSEANSNETDCSTVALSDSCVQLECPIFRLQRLLENVNICQQFRPTWHLINFLIVFHMSQFFAGRRAEPSSFSSSFRLMGAGFPLCAARHLAHVVTFCSGPTSLRPHPGTSTHMPECLESIGFSTS